MKPNSLPSKVWLRAGWAVLALLATGCGLTQISVPSGGVLFQDSFTHTGSGWDRYRDETYASDYVGESYHIEVFKANTDAWATPKLNLSDVRVEVEATRVGGPDDNVFGVICRYQNPRDFYFFLISSDGFAGIGINKDGRRRLLSSESMLPSPAVLTGDATNHIRADCTGYLLALHVNGVPVAETRAAEWSEGDVGLIAGTYDRPGTEIRFDNFSIRQP